jgi:hypothetical protein
MPRARKGLSTEKTVTENTSPVRAAKIGDHAKIGDQTGLTLSPEDGFS